MNWYKIFYWVTVADGVKSFFDAFSNLFTTLFIICGLVFIILFFCYAANKSEGNIDESEDKSWKYWITAMRRSMIWFSILAAITWAGYVFCPSKKDAVVIIAGGAVGNFITSDSSARQIPAELTLLIREKMKSEIKDLKTDISADTLQSKSKEELIELLKKK